MSLYINKRLRTSPEHIVTVSQVPMHLMTWKINNIKGYASLPILNRWAHIMVVSRMRDTPQP